MSEEGSVSLGEGINLPDNYTIEFDVVAHPDAEDTEVISFGFYMYSAENPKDLTEGWSLSNYSSS